MRAYVHVCVRVRVGSVRACVRVRVYTSVYMRTCVCVCVLTVVYVFMNMCVHAYENFRIVMQARNVMSSMGAALLTNGRHIG